LAAFAEKHGLPHPVNARDAEIGQLKTELMMQRLLEPEARKPRTKRGRAHARKPVPATVAALRPPQEIPMRPQTMGEMLRAYGHLKG